MRKTRSDSKLMHMPEGQQAQLAEWLLSGLPYHKARELVNSEFGVRVGLSAFSGFWEQVCAPQLIRRRQRAVDTADAVADAASAAPGQLDAATVDALKQKAFELAISPQAEPRDIRSLFVLLQKARDQEIKLAQIDIDRRRLELLERKAAQAEAAEGVTKDSTLTPEQQQARLKEIFGLPR